MRLWHLTLAVILVSVILSLIRDPVGRVAVIVFFTGLGEVVMGTSAILALFQTLGALGEAKGLVAHTEALMATGIVLSIATGAMSAWLWIGVWLVKTTVV
ncbi:hypothetical protein [Singulisphaera sp. PoT]|uniref:hypothetical protein n=1 Tax=Singulisphaera sp. PoT TaxID=3411797 RepID=UPI003BF4DF7E